MMVSQSRTRDEVLYRMVMLLRILASKGGLKFESLDTDGLEFNNIIIQLH